MLFESLKSLRLESIYGWSLVTTSWICETFIYLRRYHKHDTCTRGKVHSKMASIHIITYHFQLIFELISGFFCHQITKLIKSVKIVHVIVQSKTNFSPPFTAAYVNCNEEFNMKIPLFYGCVKYLRTMTGQPSNSAKKKGVGELLNISI